VREPRPNANRGDNLTGTSPYQDSAEVAAQAEAEEAATEGAVATEEVAG
jgi:hypothetical protein